jgi:hypothetical protein
MGLKYASAAGSRIRISQAGSATPIEVDLPATGSDNTWRTKIVEGIAMTMGKQELTVEVLDGSLKFQTMRFVDAPTLKLPQADNFDSGSFSTKWSYRDGTWNFTNQELVSSGWGKCLFGSQFTNYTASVDINYQTNINGGLLIRASNPALGGAGNDVQAGADFVQGYFVTLSGNSCILGKHNYNWTQLATAPGSYVTGKWYKMAVKVEDDNIKVYVDDMTTPVINFTDPDPFIAGKAGFRSFNATIHFNNLELVQAGNPTSLETTQSGKLDVYPNPAREALCMSFPAPTCKGATVELFSTAGALVYQSSIPENQQQYSIPVSSLNTGLFFLRYKDNLQNFSSKVQIDK